MLLNLVKPFHGPRKSSQVLDIKLIKTLEPLEVRKGQAEGDTRPGAEASLGITHLSRWGHF